MKTKLTLLAAALIVGISSTSAFAGRDWNYFPAAPSRTSAPVKAAFKSCCDTRNVVMPNASGKGVTVNKNVTCNTGCAAPHAGKSCDTKERKVCAN
ncbi:MAG: hypothetical protein K1X78_17685 [Verrucomicrobiaceae bacterium]|nr:hypothetical protein [Verrucomicrobiaceae bacterium]